MGVHSGPHIPRWSAPLSTAVHTRPQQSMPNGSQLGSQQRGLKLVPWNQRGTEWAAVVIQQGLSGLPLPPALSNEARSRLESYELLTGKIAPTLVDWIREKEVTCSDRPTRLSRPIADRNGRTCASSSSSTGHEITFPATSL